MSLERQMRDELADRCCALDRRIGLVASLHREPRSGAAPEGRAVAPAALGIAELAAVVGGLIRQGQPLPAVLTGLCQLFDAAVKGFASAVLLLDRSDTKVRLAAGGRLPASYLQQLEGRSVSWVDTPFGATIDGKGQEPDPAPPPGLRLHEVWPIVSLTGEPLGVFVVYQCQRNPDSTRRRSALIRQFTQVAGAAIERVQGDEALKRSSALLERTQQLSSTCCFSWCVETDEIRGSKELPKLFALDPAEVTVTLGRIGARMHSEDLPSFQRMIERARRGASDLEFEYRLRLPDDSVKYLHVVLHRTVDREGPPEYIGAVQDVTHRRHTEEALAKLRAELAQAARVTSLGVLTAAIAHEVNQPLAGIVANASTCRRMLAADPPDVEGARETARRTIRDAERASEVVKRLRALFGKKGASSELLDLNEATREVLALTLSELERNRIIVRTELAAELPRVMGDRVQLQQVILNLLLNAQDAMSAVDERPRQLLISTELEAADRVRLSVRDTGMGFEPQGVDRIFDAFYTTKSGGMGIGLSVSRFIIESHKGRLWATPNDGPGATFSFYIPGKHQGLRPAVTHAEEAPCRSL
jgi:signal transduction histidine kinase